MAKEEKSVEAIPAPQVIPAKAEPKKEYDLQIGQVIIHPKDKPEAEILTTLNDWNSMYNAGENEGKFVLLAEKKS